VVRLQVKNIKNVEDALKKYGVEAVKEFEEVIIDEATKMAEIAKVKAPVNDGTLQNSIQWRKETNLKYNVGTNLPYAPYIEFGTGAKVQIPAEFAKMAQRAKGKGKGSFKDGLVMIKAWCRKKGIDEKFAYIIFVNLLNKGMNAQPFMYPAFLEGKRTYKKGMKEAIKRLNKDFNNG